MKIAIAVVLLLVGLIVADKDYALVRSTLSLSDTSALLAQNLDIWRITPVTPTFRQIDFLCETPCVIPNVITLDPSLAQTIKTEQIEIQTLRALYNISTIKTADEFFTTFRPYSEWLVFFTKLESLYPSFIERFIIGKTIEARDIIGFRVTSPTGANKPAIHLQGLQHAREWLAPTTLLYVVVNLLEKYQSGDADARVLLDSFEWNVVPVVNIDGYLFTWSSTRLWRKNRRVNSDGSRGVDLNRNWGPSRTWCTTGSSRQPSSDTYCGLAPFSEPESKSLSDFLITKRGQTRAGIDFHTYGPLLLWPWQYTYDYLPPADYAMFQSLGKNIVDAINDVNGQNYISEQGSDLYTHSGGFIDYNWEENGIIAFTLEGRGNNFVVPPANIVPAGEEAYAGVVVLANYVLSKEKNVVQ